VQHGLPLWTEAGIDKDGGGFFEKIDSQGHAVEAPRRTRVVARQIYVFATAARQGWAVGADRWVDHGLYFLLQKMQLKNGTFPTSVKNDGSVLDATFDLYEQAFALFALASAAQGRPDRQALRGEALRLLAALRDRWAHPRAGFEEAAPRSLPLRSNPHMHLLEAALAWVEMSAGADRVVWEELADELVALCLTRFIDPTTGALRENFDGEWQPMPGPAGRLVEPGHQFEWAWLLWRWAELKGGDPRARAAARRLLEIGEHDGVDPVRGVAVNALDDTLRITDAAAKLWPQTERIKAWHQAIAEAPDPASAAHARERLDASVAGLGRYLVDSPAGLWEEQMRADGSFDTQDCRASSLYHVVCAIETLQRGVAGAGA
jgi:mannose-6-phosphate isomerase